MRYFSYGEQETAYLKSRDKILGQAIDRIGAIQRVLSPDLFDALVSSIIAQQISAKAHQTVYSRLHALAGGITPIRIAHIPAETIQQCGMSMKKANYIKGAAQKVLDNELNLDELYTLTDEEVCRRLSQLNGIGVWTAEMLMIFSMERKDILSYGDLAIHKGLQILYRHEKLDKKLFDVYKRRYSPYASVASLYLWAVAAGGYENGDPAQ